MRQTNLQLSEIRGGAIEERFAYELARVMENIGDPNTEPRQKRKITIELTFAPSENRDVVMIDIATKTKLASPKRIQTLANLEPSGDTFVAVEPRQQPLFDDQAN